MEKRFLFFLSFCLLILFAYPYYLQKITPAAPVGAQQETGGQSPAEQRLVQEGPEEIIEKPKKLEPAEISVLETEYLRLSFSNLGGSVEGIELPRYLDKDTGGFVSILEPGLGMRSFGIVLEKLNSADYFFKKTAMTQESITYEAVLESWKIRKTFEMEGPYQFRLLIDLENIGSAAMSAQYELFADENVSFQNQYDARFRKVSVFKADQLHSASFDKVNKKGWLIEGAGQWVALQKKYFSLFVLPEVPLAHIRALALNKDNMRAVLKTEPKELLPGEHVTQAHLVYAGPSEYERLKNLGHNFQKIMTGGFWGAFRLLLLFMLGFFHQLFQNYGLAIVALTITIKILFIPLTHQSFSSMRKMQELQPKLKALQEQHRNDPQKLNKEVMEMYKKHKVNPLGGCFPILLQLPIFIALYHTLSESVELRGAPFFGWIQDLSEPDRLFHFPFTIPMVNIDSFNVLPILMMISMVVQQKVSPAAGQTKEQQHVMLLMSVVFGFVFYNLPSGLVLYWFLNNVISIGHQALFHKNRNVITA